jgi:GTP-binding nuclear protein Ran
MDQLYKVILVGHPGIGKTTFVRSLNGGEFQEHYVPSVGVDVKPVRLQTPKGNVFLNIWDCAGEEKYGGLRDGYYIGSAALILMYALDQQDSQTCLESYFQSLTRVVGVDVPIVVCGNRKDSGTNKTKWAEEKNIEHFEISAKNKENIWDPIFSLVRKLLHDPTVEITVPSSSTDSLNFSDQFPPSPDLSSSYPSFSPDSSQSHFSPIPDSSQPHFSPIPGSSQQHAGYHFQYQQNQPVFPSHIPEQMPHEHSHPQVLFLHSLINSVNERIDQKDRELNAIFDFLEKKFGDFNRNAVTFGSRGYHDHHDITPSVPVPHSILPVPQSVVPTTHGPSFGFSTESISYSLANMVDDHLKLYGTQEISSGLSFPSTLIPEESGADVQTSNALLLFGRTEKEKVLQENPTLDNDSIWKKIREKWDKLTPEEKAPFEKQAQDDKDISNNEKII